MLKIPKGLKKKKKGKKNKGKDEELFTSEELEAYRRQQAEGGGARDEQWATLAAGVDGVLQKTNEDLTRIKATSFFQREAPRAAAPPPPPPPPLRPVPQVTAADFGPRSPHIEEHDSSDEEEDEEEDIFDTSYVEAAARGEVRLACVPDSPDSPDEGLFDTSHVDALISGRGPCQPTGGLPDIGLAVGVLTGRIDQVSVVTPRRKRQVPGDLLLEESARACVQLSPPAAAPRSILDADDEELPAASPVDLSVSLHTHLLQQSLASAPHLPTPPAAPPADEEDDEFTALAAESLEVVAEVTHLEIQLEPVVQDSWSAFEADKSESVFAEFIVEDQIDVVDPYLGQDDPFDTSFVEPAVPPTRPPPPSRPPAPSQVPTDDDDFDPRAEELPHHNNRRKSSVRIHLTDPSGLRESISSQEQEPALDLLAGSNSDLTRLHAEPLDPLGVKEEPDIDPFDTTIVDSIVAPGKIELRLLEQELIGEQQRVSVPAPPLRRVPSDPDFDPRAERRASRPEALAVAKIVAFIEEASEPASRPPKPVTPYRPADLLQTVTDSHSAKVLTPDALGGSHGEAVDPFDTSFASTAPTKTELKLLAREFSCEEEQAPQPADLLEHSDDLFAVAALSPAPLRATAPAELDPFDTSFATELRPGRTELRLLESELLH